MDVQRAMTRPLGVSTGGPGEGGARGCIARLRAEHRPPGRPARLTPVLGSLAAVAWGLSCAPLPDTCEELGTCGAPDATAERRCDPTMEPQDNPCVLDNTYGVFVASAPELLGGGSTASEAGMPAGNGTAEHPFATIAQGLANLGSKRHLYVCNGVYNEQVRITTAVSVYGGLSCASESTGRVWSYAGGSAQVTSPLPAYALSVTGVDGGPVTIEDLSFASPDATEAGSSSLAALIASSTVALRRVTLRAGKGADGLTGADGRAHPNYYAASAPDGGAQAEPPLDGGPFTAVGGLGAVNECAMFGASAGGNGGVGCATGGLGTPGSAMPPAPSVLPGHDGQPMGALQADGGTVRNADPGADGLAGDGGLTPLAHPYGTLSASGWVPSSGGGGDPGGPGQGGAGATDSYYGFCGIALEGVAGGGGGAGGCGGSGGQGGGGGGASLALASVASTITLTTCTLVAGAGGTGGAGGAGQDGQPGGAGGNGSRVETRARGASGGNGAGGSGGAGGPGGISVGILQSSSSITSDTTTMQNAKLGAPGAGGAGGMAGRHGLGPTVTTGMDGHSGVSGGPGTSAFLWEPM
jgi:hypothetical protein